MSEDTSVRNETQPRVQTPRSVRGFESAGINYSAVLAVFANFISHALARPAHHNRVVRLQSSESFILGDLGPARDRPDRFLPDARLRKEARRRPRRAPAAEHLLRIARADDGGPRRLLREGRAGARLAQRRRSDPALLRALEGPRSRAPALRARREPRDVRLGVRARRAVLPARAPRDGRAVRGRARSISSPRTSTSGSSGSRASFPRPASAPAAAGRSSRPRRCSSTRRARASSAPSVGGARSSD